MCWRYNRCEIFTTGKNVCVVNISLSLLKNYLWWREWIMRTIGWRSVGTICPVIMLECQSFVVAIHTILLLHTENFRQFHMKVWMARWIPTDRVTCWTYKIHHVMPPVKPHPSSVIRARPGVGIYTQSSTSFPATAKLGRSYDSRWLLRDPHFPLKSRIDN